MKFNIFINGVRVTHKTMTNDKNVKGAKLKMKNIFLKFNKQPLLRLDVTANVNDL